MPGLLNSVMDRMSEIWSLLRNGALSEKEARYRFGDVVIDRVLEQARYGVTLDAMPNAYRGPLVPKYTGTREFDKAGPLWLRDQKEI